MAGLVGGLVGLGVQVWAKFPSLAEWARPGPAGVWGTPTCPWGARRRP